MSIFEMLWLITLAIWIVMFVMWVASMVKKKTDDIMKYCFGIMISALFLNIFNLLNKL